VLLAGATAPEPLPVHDLVEADLWDQLPADLPDLLALLPHADLYLQDDIQLAFHTTLTRIWSRRGRRGQRLVEAPGENRKVYGFGLVDWREGWFDGRVAAGRTADVFCEQVRAAVARSRQRGRVAIVIADNLKTHTSAGSLLVHSMLTDLQEHLHLVYTPVYDPDANRLEWLWLGLLRRCSLILAVPLHQTRLLFRDKLMRHEQDGEPRSLCSCSTRAEGKSHLLRILWAFPIQEHLGDGPPHKVRIVQATTSSENQARVR
jgi:hypothetical protein